MPIGGTSYQPGAMPGASPLSPSPDPQEAVQVLNLRLPKRAPNSPIPSSLLSAQGGGGGDAALTNLLRALMQAFGSGGGGREVLGGGGPGVDTGQIGARPMMPMPRVRPSDGSEGVPVPREELPPMADGDPIGSLFDAPGSQMPIRMSDVRRGVGRPLF